MRILRCAGMKKADDTDIPENIEPPHHAYREAFHQWFNDSIRIMGLSDQRIFLSSQHSDNDSYASVDLDFNYRKYTIHVCDGFHLLDLSVQRRKMGHELCHVLVSPLLVPYESLEEILSQDAWTIAKKMADNMEEHTVTSMEMNLIEKILPLPPQFTPLPKVKTRKKP